MTYNQYFTQPDLTFHLREKRLTVVKLPGLVSMISLLESQDEAIPAEEISTFLKA